MHPVTSTDWLIRLIGYDTVSSRSNLALIAQVQAFVETLGMTAFLTKNKDGTKANLFATLCNADDPSKGKSGGIVLSGHTDVVPVTGQAWTHDPFCGYVKDGKVFGRGACDMKGFIGCVLAFLPKAVLAAKDNRLKAPLHIALSFDEEVGCLGVPLLLDDLQNRGITPAYCIVGEPTGMQVVVAHKGISTYSCAVQGKACHSSLTQGVNAISYAAKMIAFIDEFACQLKDIQADGFDVPFSTLSVGTIKGGTATNIVPDYCEFCFDYRSLPAMPKDTLTPIFEYAQKLSQIMQKTHKDSFVKITQKVSVPAMNDGESMELQKLAFALVGGQMSKVAYATEGGQFTKAGIPTIICGPGSIEQAHKADEFVEVSQLSMCEDFLQKMLISGLPSSDKSPTAGKGR